MPSLEDRLARIRAAAQKDMPEEAKEAAGRAIRELIESGAHERAKGPGDRAPDFELPDSEGNKTGLASLRADGPVVVTFFRGHW